MSSWDTTTGLLETFQLETAEAWFGTNDKYNKGKTLLLNLKGPATVDGDVVDPEHLVMLSCGDKWKAGQGGAVAVNTAGAEGFNEQSAVGKLIDGIKELGSDAIDIMKTRGDSFEAETWSGLLIDFDRQKTGEFKDRDTGEVRDVFNYIPQTLAVSRGADIDAPAAKSNAGGGKAAAAKLRVAVKKLASDYDDNDDFVTAVLDPDVFDQASAVEENEELLDAIIDGSIYAEAH